MPYSKTNDYLEKLCTSNLNFNKCFVTFFRQEGVDQKIYFVFEGEILTPEGKVEKCRLYQQVDTPTINENELLPDDRKPSGTYLDVIIQGAKESNLPEEYQKFLKSFPHNGYTGAVNLNLLLDEK